MAAESVYIRAVGPDGVLRTTNDVIGTAAGEAKYYSVMMTGPERYGKFYFHDRSTYAKYRDAEQPLW